MNRDDTLLTDAYRTLARDWSDWSLGTYLSDEYGRFSFRAQHAGTGRYLAFIKAAGLHAGQASFMAKGVRCARHEGRWLVLFCTEAPDARTAWVFHPEQVGEYGKDVTLTSKKGIAVDALQVNAADHGVRLAEHLAGRAGPRRDATKPTALGQYGGVES